MVSAGHVWTYPATVIRVIDGDTIRLDLDLGLRIWRTDNCRIAGINTPEMNTAAGKAAKAYAETLLTPGLYVMFESLQLDKYGRPLGAITGLMLGDFARAMLAAGHAVPYAG